MRTGHPVRSGVLKHSTGCVVVGWVTTSEFQLLYVPSFCQFFVLMIGTRNGMLHMDSHGRKCRHSSKSTSRSKVKRERDMPRKTVHFALPIIMRHISASISSPLVGLQKHNEVGPDHSVLDMPISHDVLHRTQSPLSKKSQLLQSQPAQLLRPARIKALSFPALCSSASVLVFP